MPKTLISSPNLNNKLKSNKFNILSSEISPKSINKDKLKEFKENLLTGSGFLQIY